MQLSKSELNRYSRHILLNEIGESGQLKLKKSKVLVVGAGGLGCPILQYLGAAGVGKIGIIDMDKVEVSNLQRQLLYNEQDIGNNKASIAAEKIQTLNPFIEIVAYPYALNTTNVFALFEAYDIIVDGTDNFASRYMINDASLQTQKPLVYGAIFKFEGQVAVFNYQNGPSYRCLFPTAPRPDEVPDCSEAGVLGVLPGIIGTLQATEVLKIILGIGQPLSGKFMTYNALNNQTMILEVERNESIISATLKTELTTVNYEVFCGINKNKPTKVKEIEAQVFLENTEEYTLLDVRELWEQPRIKGRNVLEIPLPRIIERKNEIPKNKTIVVFCAKGIRSKIAIQELQKNGYSNLINLTGGIKDLKSIR
jgi:adenylyltransferase/sulfurtransferase